jgi:hypothetical protein
VDQQGHVYIGGADDIHRLSPDGTFRDIVLSKHDGVPSFIKYKNPSFIKYKNPSFLKYKNPSFIKYKNHSFIKYKNPSFLKYKNPHLTITYKTVNYQ